MLQEKGYVNSIKAAAMMGMKGGGNVIRKLQDMGVECISFPSKSGEGQRWLCSSKDISDALVSQSIPGGEHNGGKMMSRLAKLEARVLLLEQTLSRVSKEDLR